MVHDYANLDNLMGKIHIGKVFQIFLAVGNIEI